MATYEQIKTSATLYQELSRLKRLLRGALIQFHDTQVIDWRNLMPIQVVETALRDVRIIEPRVFGDERGFFFESFNERDFEQVAPGVHFVQDNQSMSRRGVVRGLHYQLPPHGQGKLVRAIAGTIYDVAVDVRRSSPTFGQWVGVELSAENFRQLWIPAGFAHGFVALSECAMVAYKTTTYWEKSAEVSIRWDDPTLAIDWPLDEKPILSGKDALSPYFENARFYP